MDRRKNNGSSIFTGIFCAIAGVAIGIGGKAIYDEFNKEEKEDENRRQLALEEIRQDIKNKNDNKIETSTKETYSDDNLEYESFFCPISQEIMKDPVITPKGISFDRESILSWLSKDKTCPITKTLLKESDLITNYALKNTIEEFVCKQKI